MKFGMSQQTKDLQAKVIKIRIAEIQKEMVELTTWLNKAPDRYIRAQLTKQITELDKQHRSMNNILMELTGEEYEDDNSKKDIGGLKNLLESC